MQSKLKFLALALLAGGTMFAQPRISIGIGVGVPQYYAPPVYYAPPAYSVPVYSPPYPGPGYTWVHGYYGPRRVWVSGYWRAPYAAPYRVAPRYYGPRYSNSYRGYARGHYHR